MSKSTFFISSLGILSGFIAGSVFFYIALDTNPQMEYTLNPEGLIWVFYFALGTTSFPFALIASAVEIAGVLKKKHASLNQYILLAGIFFGGLVGLIAVLISPDSTVNDPRNIIPAFFGGAGAASFPFTLWSCVLESFRMLKNRKKL